jgi:hypothetical protein
MNIQTVLVSAVLTVALPALAQVPGACLERPGGGAPGTWGSEAFKRCVAGLSSSLGRVGNQCDAGQCPIKTVRPTYYDRPAVLDTKLTLPAQKPKEPQCGVNEVVVDGQCVCRDSEEAKAAEARVIAGLQALIAAYRLPVELTAKAPHAQKAIASVGK